MKKKNNIKSINEYFTQSLGDAFNSSNGVFKVNYRTFDDLSIPVGREPDPSLWLKDSIYRIGDFVSGKVKGMKKRIKGIIVEINKAVDGDYYIIKIQRFKDKKKYTLLPGSIRFLRDNGNIINTMKPNVEAIKRNIQKLKYTGGNIFWGSMESKHFDDFYVSFDEIDNTIDGFFKTGWKIIFVDNISSFYDKGYVFLKTFVIDNINNLIFVPKKFIINEMYDKIKAIEAFSYIFFHPDLKQYDDSLRYLISILFLDMKNEKEAKNYLISKSMHIIHKSYDENYKKNFLKAKSIINKFLEY